MIRKTFAADYRQRMAGFIARTRAANSPWLSLSGV